MIERRAALLVLAGVSVFWAAMLAGARVNPGYAHRRDYVSALAARGVEHPWLGMVAIAMIGCAGLAAAALVRRLTRAGALAFAAAGVGFVVVALARVDCPDGAARCGLGGRFEVHGTAAITHWTAAVVSSILVIVGMAVVGIELVQRRRMAAGAATLVAAGTTLVALLATGGQSPGTVQRIWILVMTGWLAGAAAVALVRSAGSGR